MRRFDEAKAILEKVSAVDKDFPGLTLEWGLLFEDSGQRDKALESYRAALEKAPNDVDLKLHVGSNQVMAGHAEEALEILKEVRSARPNSAEANHFLGRALLLSNQNLGEALRYLEAAVNIDANRAEYYLYVGWAANELNQQAKAAPALNKAIELDHDLGDAYWQRGVLLQKQGATLDALSDLQHRAGEAPFALRGVGHHRRAAIRTSPGGPRRSRRGAAPSPATIRWRSGTTGWASSSRGTETRPPPSPSWSRPSPSGTSPASRCARGSSTRTTCSPTGSGPSPASKAEGDRALQALPRAGPQGQRVRARRQGGARGARRTGERIGRVWNPS